MTAWKTLCALVGGGVRNPAALAGWLLLAVLIGHQARHCGTQWEAGRWGMPRSLVSPDDPTRYADGAPIDPVTLALIRSGREEQFFAVAAAILAAGLGLNTWLCWRYYRRLKRRALDRFWAESHATGGRTPPRRCPHRPPTRS